VVRGAAERAEVLQAETTKVLLDRVLSSRAEVLKGHFTFSALWL
jgi:hypothetical protein